MRRTPDDDERGDGATGDGATARRAMAATTRRSMRD
jgi:hypothetical protein